MTPSVLVVKNGNGSWIQPSIDKLPAQSLPEWLSEAKRCQTLVDDLKFLVRNVRKEDVVFQFRSKDYRALGVCRKLGSVFMCQEKGEGQLTLADKVTAVVTSMDTFFTREFLFQAAWMPSYEVSFWGCRTITFDAGEDGKKTYDLSEWVSAFRPHINDYDDVATNPMSKIYAQSNTAVNQAHWFTRLLAWIWDLFDPN